MQGYIFFREEDVRVKSPSSIIVSRYLKSKKNQEIAALRCYFETRSKMPKEKSSDLTLKMSYRGRERLVRV